MRIIGCMSPVKELEKVVDWLFLILYNFKLHGDVFSSSDWPAKGNPETYNRQKPKELISSVLIKNILKFLLEDFLQNEVIFLIALK